MQTSFAPLATANLFSVISSAHVRRNYALRLTERAPFAAGSGAVDTKNHKRRLPLALCKSPHVGVTILRAADDPVGVGRPVDSGHHRVVLSKRVLKRKLVSLSDVDLDFVRVWADCNLLLHQCQRAGKHECARSVKTSAEKQTRAKRRGRERREGG